MILNAILVEGAAEQAIIDILLEHSLLIIENDECLLENGPLRVRSGDHFCDRYLNRNFTKVHVYRVLDSKKENFKLGSKNRKAFADKIKVHNVITSPEIEILYILGEGKYDEFSRSKLKPSDFCKQKLKCKDIKAYDFVYAYFSDIEKLLKVLKEYHSKHHSSSTSEKTLYDLLKLEYLKNI